MHLTTAPAKREHRGSPDRPGPRRTPGSRRIEDTRATARAARRWGSGDALCGTVGWYWDASGGFIPGTPDTWNSWVAFLVFPRITSSSRIERRDIGRLTARSHHVSTLPVADQVRELHGSFVQQGGDGPVGDRHHSSSGVTRGRPRPGSLRGRTLRDRHAWSSRRDRRCRRLRRRHRAGREGEGPLDNLWLADVADIREEYPQGDIYSATAADSIAGRSVRPRPEPREVGEGNPPVHFSFLIDRSGSMSSRRSDVVAASTDSSPSSKGSRASARSTSSGTPSSPSTRCNVYLTVRRGKARFPGGCEAHPATVAPAGSSQSGSWR